MLVGKALSFTQELSFYISFYQSIVLNSRAEDGHQMYIVSQKKHPRHF